MQSLPSSSATPPSPGASRLGGCGCGLIFILLGGTPILAALNILPREEFFGETPPWIAVLFSIPFVAIGLYFIARVIAQDRAFPRWLANSILLVMAIPFHYWLFFGKGIAGSVTFLGLPGLEIVLPGLPGWVSLLSAKLVVAALVIIIDLVLLSEFAGLGWFAWSNFVMDEETDEDSNG